MHLGIDLRWQIVLKVAVSCLRVFNQTGHLSTSFLGCRYTHLKYADLLLQFRPVVVLITHHSTELSAIDLELLDSVMSAIQACSNLFFELDQFAVSLTTVFIEEFFILFELMTLKIELFNEFHSLFINLLQIVVLVIDSGLEQIRLLDRFLNIVEHAFFLNLKSELVEF